MTEQKLSPYEENILGFIQITKEKPELFTREVLDSLRDHLTEQISHAISSWLENHPQIENAFLNLSSNSSELDRAAAARKPRLTAKEIQALLENLVRQSDLPPEAPPTPPKK